MRLPIVVSLALLVASCGSASTPEAASGPPDLLLGVDPGRPRQVLDDVSGGNFVHTFSRVQAGLDPVGRLNFDGLAPRHIRLRMALEDWEPENDDRNPERASAGGFRDDGYNRGAFLLAQEAAARGVGLTASIWDVPDWMVSNPASDRRRKIPPALYPELAESMAEWLRTARAYGAEFQYVSFNEADAGVNVSLTPAEHAALVAEVGRRLAARGFGVRWLLGDCSNMADCLAYAKPIWEAPAARPYLGAFAFHTWGQTATDAGLAALYDFGRATGLPVRGTEGGWDTRLWQRPQEFPTWTNALRLASVYVRVLRLTGASVMQYWQMLGHDYNLNDGANRYPAWLLLRQFRDHLPPGSQVLETSGDAGSVVSLAARAGSDVTFLAVNGGAGALRVALAGLPGGSYRQLRSTASGVGQEQSTVSGGAAVTLTLPAESVTLLTTRR